jgi:hypothetical protein
VLVNRERERERESELRGQWVAGALLLNIREVLSLNFVEQVVFPFNPGSVAYIIVQFLEIHIHVVYHFSVIRPIMNS